jgi:hypothetical protein
MRAQFNKPRRPMRTIGAAVAIVGAGALIGPQLAVNADSTPTPERSTIQIGPETVFVPVESYRAYDSRSDTEGKIRASQAGDIGRNQRPVWAPYENQEAPALIPADAIAVTYNATAVQTEGSGFMQIDGFFLADGDTSTIVWNTAGQRIANSGVAQLTSAFDEQGALGVYVNGSSDAASHVIIDITGYFVPVT